MRTTNQWKLGLFVVLGVIGVVAAGVWIGARQFDQATISLYTFFDEPVEGLEVGAPVKFRGIPIGSVSSMSTRDRRWIQVRADLGIEKLEQIGLRPPDKDPDAPPEIPPGLRTRIVRSFVTSIAHIDADFVPAGTPIPDYGFPLPANTVHSIPSSQANLERGLNELLAELPGLLSGARGVAENLNRTLASEDVAAVVSGTRELIESANAQLSALDLPGLQQDLRATLDDLRAAASEYRRLAERFNGETGSLARLDRVLATLESQLRDLGLPETATAVRTAAEHLVETLHEVRFVLPDLRDALVAIRDLALRLDRDPSALIYGRPPAPDPRSLRSPGR